MPRQLSDIAVIRDGLSTNQSSCYILVILSHVLQKHDTEHVVGRGTFWSNHRGRTSESTELS